MFITYLITGKYFFSLSLLGSFFAPLQGLPNAIVYLAPKYRALQQQHQVKRPLCKLLCEVVWSKISEERVTDTDPQV